jgi:hypothetical protein
LCSSRFIWLFYKGRKIISCVAVDGNLENKCGLLSAFLNSINSKSVICEYANAVPRVWATVFNLKIISLVFGVLDRKDFDFERRNGFHCLKKMQKRLYADEYVLFGSHNPTLDLSKDIERFYKSIVRSEVRKDLPIQHYIPNKKVWAVYIGQPWKELGIEENERIQKFIFEILSKNFISSFYCAHPRQNSNSDLPEKTLNGWHDLIRKIEEDGPPTLAVSINSSVLYELMEIGISAVPLATRVYGDSSYPDLESAVGIINRAINFIIQVTYMGMHSKVNQVMVLMVEDTRHIHVKFEKCQNFVNIILFNNHSLAIAT